MNYQAVLKKLPEYTVYYKQFKVRDFSEYGTVIPAIGAEIGAANPGLKCIEPSFCYVEYLDGVLVPGFVNTHSHLELAYMKGVVPQGTGLPGFVRRVMENKAAFSEEVQRASARSFVDKYCKPGKPSLLSVYASAMRTEAFTEELYEYSRKKFL